MIRYIFNCNPVPSEEKQNGLKEWFEKKLGDMKAEFEENDGVVTFNCHLPETDVNYTSYALPDKEKNFDFYGRFQEYLSEQHNSHH